MSRDVLKTIFFGYDGVLKSDTLRKQRKRFTLMKERMLLYLWMMKMNDGGEKNEAATSFVNMTFHVSTVSFLLQVYNLGRKEPYRRTRHHRNTL